MISPRTARFIGAAAPASSWPGPATHRTASPEPPSPEPPSREPPAPADAPAASYQEQKRAAERAIVVAALEANEWVISRTARSLDLSDHSSLIKIMKRLGVRRPGRQV